MNGEILHCTLFASSVAIKTELTTCSFRWKESPYVQGKNAVFNQIRTSIPRLEERTKFTFRREKRHSRARTQTN